MAQISFSAQGEQLTAFRDALRDGHFACTAQQMRGGVFYAKTQAHHWYGICAAAQEHDITLTILKRRGLCFRIAPYRLRLGLIVGILCGFAFFYWCNAHVRSIEIYGNTQVSDTEILAALERLGVTRGTAYRDMNFTYIEQRMRLEVQDLRWIAMRHTGGRLVIDLREETAAPEMTHDRIPTNYISNVSAQITEIQVLGGYAAVQVGDAVKAGDLLISGVQEDPNGVTRFYHADGVVRGVYEYDLELFQPFCEELTVSGESVTARCLELFGKRFPLSIGFTPPEEPFVYTEEATPFTVFGYVTPFALLHCRYTPQTTTIAAYSEAEIDALLTEQATRFEQNFHSEDQILSKEIVPQRTDLGILLKIHYVFEGSIGETREIFVR